MLLPAVQERKDALPELADAIASAISCANTRRWLHRRLRIFLAWCEEEGRPFTRRTVLDYRTHLEESGLSRASVNQALIAIRKLAREAADSNWIDHGAAESICAVKGKRQLGTRAGRWLTKDEARRLRDAPDPATLKGKRDRALLALLLGTALRRAEAVAVRVEDMERREGRWMFPDMEGKGGRIRTVLMPSWAATRIHDWLAAAGITSGPILRRVRAHGKVQPEGLTTEGLYFALKEYARQCEVDIAPHDLRRTFGKLAKKGGAETRAIMAQLGHSSERVTNLYIGEDLHLEDPACDRLGMEGE